MKSTSFSRAACALALVSGLAACGGGGSGGGGGGLPFLPFGGSSTTTPNLPARPAPDPDRPASTGSDIVPLSRVVGRCVAPRLSGGYADRAGTLMDEKRWVRSWIDETYLWFDEVPMLRAADFATPTDYFEVLKTTAITASGKPKDTFHFWQDTATYNALVESGESLGYGIAWAFLSEQPPRDIRVAYVEPNSPAAVAGIERGMRLVSVDSEDMLSSTNVDKLNAGFAPQVGGQAHVLGFQTLDGAVREVSLSAGIVTQQPVHVDKVLDVAGTRVGYLQFNTYNALAEAPLIDAMTRFRDQGVKELVVDLRYNGGGLLGLASELAYMIAPVEKTQEQVFEQLLFNRKNPFGGTRADWAMPFFNTAGYSSRAGEALPQLQLSRVTVLAGPDTCSASESLINGLRGVGVQVNLVGNATCGKPYGFIPTDNCGVTYFAVQFQGVNAQGFGDYADGMAPTCEVPDDLSQPLGSAEEGRLKAALHWIEHGVCPPAGNDALAVSVLKSRPGHAGVRAAQPVGPLLREPPAKTVRVWRPQDMQR